jgi:hypothetical protein
MAIDNKTAHLSSNYDQEVVKNIPYYVAFHDESIKLRIGFKIVDIFWKSYMQAGFYCIKG